MMSKGNGFTQPLASTLGSVRSLCGDGNASFGFHFEPVGVQRAFGPTGDLLPVTNSPPALKMCLMNFISPSCSDIHI